MRNVPQRVGNSADAICLTEEALTTRLYREAGRRQCPQADKSPILSSHALSLASMLDPSGRVTSGSPGRISVSPRPLRQYFDEHDSSHEASDVSPKRDST